MRAVGSDGPPPSKVRAITGLLVLPISISDADTGCTSEGVSQDEEIIVRRREEALLPLLLDVPPQPTRTKKTRILKIPRPTKCVSCRCFSCCRSCIFMPRLLTNVKTLMRPRIPGVHHNRGSCTSRVSLSRRITSVEEPTSLIFLQPRPSVSRKRCT
jgi:hypothetical protein